jgi:crotonobetainyl-CoA:carnitine CoA-transferase CaiB-like acyl-CoA transferase
MRLPLDGVLVVGIEQAISAPFCTRELSDLGARVIKLEPAAGDFARHYDEVVHGVSAYFAWANRGKESLVLDLKSHSGRADLDRLVSHCDVFVQNLGPGVAEGLGLDAAALATRHPRLVAVDISGYGSGGPRSDGRAYDLLVQAESGSCAITGTAERPAKPGIPLVDIGTGMHAATAILAALIARERTGEGAVIAVSMFDVATDWMSWALHRARFTGEDITPCGVGSPLVAPYGAYPTRDGQTIVIGTTNDREWQRLATGLLDRPDLAADPRYATTRDRVTRRDELDEVIGAWVVARGFDETARRATAAGLGWARFNRPTEVVEHPQLVERGRWRETGAPGGSFPSLAPAATVAGWDWSPRPVPATGEHSAAIAEEFGLSS